MEPDSSSRKQAVVIGYIFAAFIGVVLLQWVLTTYNTVEATAMLTLCPSEQVLLPAAARKNIQSLSEALGRTSGQ